MNTVAEIEAAILALPLNERERLADELPSILPELNGAAQWQRIINDTRPRPALYRDAATLHWGGAPVF